MGSCFSCKSSPPLKCIRVVHLSGYVEDFAEPVTAGEVIGKPANHFLCSSAHLLSFGSQPLGLDARLESGHIYFLLPYTIFQSDSSPVDLVSLATRLTAIAKRSGSANKSLFDSPSAGPRDHMTVGSCGTRISSSVRSWKPVLQAIEERSLERRSDSIRVLPEHEHATPFIRPKHIFPTRVTE